MVKPSEVHKKVTGKVKATKNEIMNYVCTKYKDTIKVTTKSNRKSFVIDEIKYNKGNFEHVADSIVIGELGLDRLEKKVI